MTDSEVSEIISLCDSNHCDKKMIGNYILRSTIGQGTFGKVK